MSAPCILTIEDDPAIRRGIVDSLKATGHVVWQADRADTGIEKALSKPCDLVLLDLVLPGGHGLDVLAEIRKQKPTLPVIVLTAKGEEQDRVKGLRLGADDYVSYHSFERCSLALQSIPEGAYGSPGLWILGMAFLRRYAAIFDAEHDTVAFGCAGRFCPRIIPSPITHDTPRKQPELNWMQKKSV